MTREGDTLVIRIPIESTHPALDTRSIAEAALACAQRVDRAWLDAASIDGLSVHLPKAAGVVTRVLQDLLERPALRSMCD